MKLVISEQVLEQQLDDEVILLDLESGRYFGLQEVGGRAWRILATSGNTDAVQAELLTEYDIEEDVLRQDLGELWQNLLAAGLVTLAPAA